MERESLEMDVVFVGAGPANLSGALHLARLIAEHNAAVEKGERKGEPLGEIQIAVIEKGSSIGAHTLSHVICYNKKKWPGDHHPKSWADFWDVQKFPGRRVLRREEVWVTEAALKAATTQAQVNKAKSNFKKAKKKCKRKFG